jgi:hypothetical protein
MDIMDKQGKWWQARKADGRIGSEHCPLIMSSNLSLTICTVAPSNYLQVI